MEFIKFPQKKQKEYKPDARCWSSHREFDPDMISGVNRFNQG